MPPIEGGEKGSCSPDLWMQSSFSDPCMFHAVLFAASPHLDIIRRERDNPITYYHRHNAVQLLLSNISKCKVVPDTSIAATVHLWQYDVSQYRYAAQSQSPFKLSTNSLKSMNSCTEEAEVHKNGLLEMIKSAGGLSRLGMDGFLARLIIL